MQKIMQQTQDINNQSMFALTILEKIKETRLKFSQGSITDKKNVNDGKLSRSKR